MFQFIETIKISEGHLRHIEWHQRRVNRTFAHFFKDNSPLKLNAILKDLPLTGNHRVRIIYDNTSYSVECFQIQPRTFRTLKVIHADIDYDFKYADRSELQTLLEQKEDSDEILIIKNGWVTDTSISNILLFDGEEWITPSTFLLEGTTRARLIQEGKIRVRPVRIEDLKDYKKIRLINALMNFEDKIDIPLPQGLRM